MTSISFLSAFNAKAMSYEQIASSFVSSAKFAELAGQWSALLVGPRGSGKTTLLRMLSLEGMRSWSGAEADQYRRELDYTGIYVPSDIAWGEMVKSLGDGNLDGRSLNLVSEAAFATNVFMSTVSAMQLRIQTPDPADVRLNYRNVEIEPESIEEIIRFIAELWKLNPKSISFRSLHQALAARLLDIHQQSRLLGGIPNCSPALISEKMPYIGLPVLDSVNQALKAFDQAAGQNDGIWALLLDEFEVAPAPLQKDILTALRAAAPKLILKVALAPCGPHTVRALETTTPPTRSNDFRQVELWYADKREADTFCERVFTSRTSLHPVLAGKYPEIVFGKSAYAIVDETDAEGTHYAYGRGEAWAKEFMSLAQKDSSFRDFLIKKEIDSQNLDPSPDAPNGNTIRKIAPIVAFRNAYRGYREGTKRGRKPFNAAYSGWAAISAISEGNPRWLLTMLTGIFAKVRTVKDLPVDVSTQQYHAMVTSGTFADVLRTVATRQFDCIQTTTPVMQLLTKIGQYFHDRLVIDDFLEDPPMSFYVGNDIDDDTENCLRIAVNHGAIICYQPADGIGGFGTLRDKRFRLSYLLSPSFKLPIRKSKEVQLTSILNPPVLKKVASDVKPDQGNLF